MGAGRRRSARNAVVHGLEARRIVFDGAERARLSRRRRAWREDLGPTDALEMALVDAMARASIVVERVNRIDAVAWREAARRALAAAEERGCDGSGRVAIEPHDLVPDGGALRLVTRHGGRWRRALSRALDALGRLRRTASVAAPNEAIAHAEAVVARIASMLARPAHAPSGRPTAGDAEVDDARTGSIFENEPSAWVSQDAGPDEVEVAAIDDRAHGERWQGDSSTGPAASCAFGSRTAGGRPGHPETGSKSRNEPIHAAAQVVDPGRVAAGPVVGPAHVGGRPELGHDAPVGAASRPLGPGHPGRLLHVEMTPKWKNEPTAAATQGGHGASLTARSVVIPAHGGLGQDARLPGVVRARPASSRPSTRAAPGGSGCPARPTRAVG